MASKKKVGLIAALVGLALFGFSKGASADDDDEDDDDDDGPDPNGPDIVVPENPLDDVPNQPLPPLPNKCNYSGCGALFDGKHAAPSYYALRLQQLGYPIDVALVSASQSTIAVQPQRGYFEHFQRHFNNVRNAVKSSGYPPVMNAKMTPIAQVGALARDGLVGEKTIEALNLAHAAVLATNVKWQDLVTIGGGPD